MAWQSKYSNMEIDKGHIINGVTFKECLIWILKRAISSMAWQSKYYNMDIDKGNIINGIAIKVL